MTGPQIEKESAVLDLEAFKGRRITKQGWTRRRASRVQE